MMPRGRGSRPYWRGYGRGRGYGGWSNRGSSRGRGRGRGSSGSQSLSPSQSPRSTTAAVPTTTTPRRAASVARSSQTQPSTPSSQRSNTPWSTPQRPATTARTRTRGAASTTTGGPGGHRDQQIICAVTEARGIAATVGLAFVNLSTAEAVLCEIADNQTFVKTLHKLHVFDPSEVLVAATTHEQQTSNSKFRQVLAANLGPQSPINGIARKYWSESAGMAYVQALSLREDMEATKVAIEGKYYATCCFAAAMQYVEHSLNISFAMHSMRIKYEPSEDTMMIDVATIQALELIQNSQNSRSSDSLFGLLDATLTKMGARLLRSSILQPLIDQTVIETRYDALQELTSDAEIFLAARKALRSFQDVDKTLINIVIEDKRNTLHQREQAINNILAVKRYVRAVPQVFEALKNATSELLKNIRQCCAPDAVTEVSRLIDETVNDNITYQSKPIQLRNQRVYAIKAGVNGLLDIARQAYKEANDDLFQLMQDLQQLHGITIDIKYDVPRQSFFVIRTQSLRGRPLHSDFINRITKKGSIECQTLDLMKLNQKIQDSTHEVMNLGDAVVQQLIRGIRANIAPLFRISDGIAVLDMLAAFGEVASSQDYCRPEFGSTLAIKNGRHAVAEKICRAKFVPNDVYAAESKRLQIVTGCNMSGKSTYIRAIALATIMAQIGCFVPASYACFNIRTQLFARVSVDDSATSAVSTFAAEMRETAFILRNVDAGGLVIVDELGRGTSTRDGLAIAAAVAEALLQAGAFVWFVTHFRDMPLMFAERPEVSTLHLRTSRPDSDSMAMLYSVADGPAQEPHYGLTLARAVGLPPDAIAAATRVAEALEQRQGEHRAQHVPARQILVARRRKLLRALVEQLVQAKEVGLRGEELRKWMRGLQVEFVRRMAGNDDDEFGRISRVREMSQDSDVIEVDGNESIHADMTGGVSMSVNEQMNRSASRWAGRSVSCRSRLPSEEGSVTIMGEEDTESEWRELVDSDDEDEMKTDTGEMEVVHLTEENFGQGNGNRASSLRPSTAMSERTMVVPSSLQGGSKAAGTIEVIDMTDDSDDDNESYDDERSEYADAYEHVVEGEAEGAYVRSETGEEEEQGLARQTQEVDGSNEDEEEYMSLQDILDAGEVYDYNDDNDTKDHDDEAGLGQSQEQGKVVEEDVSGSGDEQDYENEEEEEVFEGDLDDTLFDQFLLSGAL